MLLRWATKELAPKIETELKRHVKPRQVRPDAKPHCGNVVDSIGALHDHPRDVAEPHFAGVIDLERTTGYKPKITNGENDSVKNCSIRIIKWAINEYVFAAESASHASFA